MHFPGERPWNVFSSQLSGHLIRRITYTTSALMSIGARVVRRPLLPQHLFKSIQSLGISRIRPRFSRGGKREKQRHITAVHRPTFNRFEEHKQTLGVNFSNLIKIPLANETSSENLTIGSINARSVKNKEQDVSELVEEKRIDILGICETWLTSGEQDNIVERI